MVVIDLAAGALSEGAYAAFLRNNLTAALGKRAQDVSSTPSGRNAGPGRGNRCRR